MTDTRLFYAIAIDRNTGIARKFWSLIPYRAGQAARAWLGSL